MNDLIGYSGVLVSSLALWPQICQIIKTEQVRDLNMYYFLLCILSDILYISYGFIESDYVMLASTVPPLLSQLTVLFLFMKYKKETDVCD